MDWSYSSIWFDRIEPQKQGTIDFKEKKTQLYISEKEYLTTWYMNSKDNALNLLPASDKLLYLELNWSNIPDFQHISMFPNLKRLELHYCTKLQSDRELSELGNSLEHLHINQSKKFGDIFEISQLKNLKVLRLNDCAPIESLSFIKSLPNLIDLRFVGTDVLDGDLTPIIEHPSLRSAGFSNKRNFNYKTEKINSMLSLKGSDYKEFVFKGDFKTFRYNVTNS
ncbi:hypothetical protein [Mucilaginibacter sp. KACC 22063]|uniref:hypothetical protein n=1 Tax=Mucilaginibacter sp. KACC 22063 TaxID=3025666 RepID=UPI00236650CB|nr:hypothetical protein [Mucilaginibacter sp. KACC 22063]WDF55376.1 hypothetical protein PQ461_20815 [Mucilaginibacter sp. KACC 22063]